MTASHRDRAWLQRFLRLGQRSGGGAVLRQRDVDRQEATVLRALAMLDEQPGVVLADEVGMGKTYEALGVVAARLHERPEARAVILTPGPDLNTKWTKDLATFCDRERPIYDAFRDHFASADSLAELVEQLDRVPVVIAPVTVFIGGRGQSDLAYLLSLWGAHRGLVGNQLAAIFRRYRDGKLEHVQVARERFLGAFPHARIAPHVPAVMRAHVELGDASLDALWKERSYDAFGDKDAVDRALTDLRFRLVGCLLPTIDLLVVDEAHKLKSADSVRTTGVRTAFGGRFERALFLTATPFQLTVRELRSVFELFALARSAPPDLRDRADGLLAHVDAYTVAYEALERVWAGVDAGVAADFAAWFERDPTLTGEPDDLTLRAIVAAGRRLLAIKREQIEPGFRQWMIRSLREDKRIYRRHRRERLRPRGGSGVPFLLYERFISELFRTGNQTHKAAVQINMVSSYGAAREGALLADAERKLEPDAEAYRRLLKEVVGALRHEDGGHPKIEFVMRDALAAIERDEKTLIFCARIETLKELKAQLERAWEQRLLARWRRAYPEARLEDIFEHKVDGKVVDGHHSRLRDRFSRAQDALYLALRERYAVTLLGGWQPAPAQVDELVRGANAILAVQRVGHTQAERFDWALAKRCVEQAAALMAREVPGADDDFDEEALRRLTDPRYVALGYDLEKDDLEDSAVGEATPTWTIDAEDAALVLRREHLWTTLTSPLHGMREDLRVRTVERLASYLVKRWVPFLPELMAFAREQGLDVERVESRALLPVVDRFWSTPEGRRWVELVRRFVVYAANLDEGRRREVLDGVLAAGDLVRHTVDGESRERLREAFNTPLYPMVLVANEVMQEGLDLHHHCRRVVHHDLAWNPAQLEQRVGRVDRLGSLVQRMRDRNPDTTLDVLLPLIANTIDERLERAVRLRERWLEFLLGAAPRIDEYGLADDPPPPLPAGFADALRVELGPREPA